MKSQILLVILASILVPAGIVKIVELSIDKKALANQNEQNTRK